MSKKRIGAQTGKKYAVRFCFPVRGQGGGSYPTKRSALWPETHFRRFLAFGCNFFFKINIV